MADNKRSHLTIMYDILALVGCGVSYWIVFYYATRKPKVIKAIGRCPVCGTQVWSGWKRCVKCHTRVARKLHPSTIERLVDLIWPSPNHSLTLGKKSTFTSPTTTTNNETLPDGSENNKVSCKRCYSHRVVKWGKEYGKQRYRCRECKKTFYE